MSRREASTPKQNEDQEPGSRSTGEPVFLLAGRFRRPHGVKGEILLEVLTDFPEQIRPGETIYIGKTHRPVVIERIRTQDQLLLLYLQGYSTREQVGELRNQDVFVTGASLPPLPEGVYYHHQLVGLRVIDPTGTLLGILDEVLETGANDVYVVRPESGPEILIPAIEPVVLGVDLGRGEMTVQPPMWE